MFGCTATPNLSNWSKASEDIRDGMVKSQSEVKANLNKLIITAKQAEKEGWDSSCGNTEDTAMNVNWSTEAKDFPDNINSWPKASEIWPEQQKLYTKAAADVELGLNAMVLYAQAVNELAASSGTGKEAAEGIVKSINSIATTLGTGIPGIDAASEVFKLISEQWTKIQVQDSLAETMSEMQENIDALAAALNEQTVAQINVIDAITDMSESAIKGTYGTERMCFYQKVQNKLYREVEEPFRIFNSAWDTKSEAEKNSMKRVIADDLIVDQFGVPIYRKYLDEIYALRAWETKNKQQAKLIGKAVNVWATTHKSVAEEMASCGGFRSLKSHCGHWTLENIKMSRDRLKALVDGFKAD